MKLIRFRKYKKILSLIWQQDGSPLFNAKGIALGVFSGCFPFFGFQTILGVLLAKIFQANLLLAALGTWVSNPFTYLPLYVFNYKIGSIILGRDEDIFSQPELLKEDILGQGWSITSRLLIGSFLVGLIAGLVCGFLTFITYKRIRRKNFKY